MLDSKKVAICGAGAPPCNYGAVGKDCSKRTLCCLNLSYILELFNFRAITTIVRVAPHYDFAISTKPGKGFVRHCYFCSKCNSTEAISVGFRPAAWIPLDRARHVAVTRYCRGPAILPKVLDPAAGHRYA